MVKESLSRYISIGYSPMNFTNMKQAVSETVSDGGEVYLGGFTHLVPFAAGHEIIRQGLTDLTIMRATPDMIYDQMIAAGCASKIVFSYTGHRGFRRAVEEGIPNEIEIEEYSHFATVSRLAAGAYNLPFMPLRTLIGSDLPKYNNKIRTVKSPYDGEEIATVPPLNPDTAFIHVPQVDENGNAHVWGILGEIRDLAFAADTVVIVAEEIVEESVIRSDPNRTLIPGTQVDYVVEEPYGAHPSYVMGYYDRDQDMYLSWDNIAQTHERLTEWLNEWVYGVEDRNEYIEKLGVKRLLELEPKSKYSTPVNLGRYQ